MRWLLIWSDPCQGSMFASRVSLGVPPGVGEESTSGRRGFFDDESL
jgi:hypothetical protein